MMKDFFSYKSTLDINNFEYCNFIFTSEPFLGRRGAALVCIFEDFK